MKPDVPDVRFMRQKHFDELVVSFSSRLAIVLPTSWAIAREAWMIKIPFRLALNKAASDKLRGIASITLDWKKAFSQCVASLAHGLGLLVSKMEESVAKYRPDLFHFPTTSGDHCTGDAFKMGEPIGAKTVDLEVGPRHPTGFVNSGFLGATSCFTRGNRFANKLSSETMPQGVVEEQASFPPRSKRSRP